MSLATKIWSQRLVEIHVFLLMIYGNWVVAKNYGVNYGSLKSDLFSSPWDGVLQICFLNKF